MHHALHLEEILLNIFTHLHLANPSRSISVPNSSNANLAALARTCRTFKEPALDVLWSELSDLSPLAFCLPECRRTSNSCYTFTKPRNDAEWDILRSYTRRVRNIVNFSSSRGSLDQHSISATFDPPLPGPLFPNLRCLIWQGGTATLPVINFAAPLLTSLDIRGAPQEDFSLYIDLLETLVPQCPNVKNIRIQVYGDLNFSKTVSRHLCCWNRLRVVDFLNVAVPVDVIFYLTHVPTLAWLSLTLEPHFPDPIPPTDAALSFSRLTYLEMVSGSLEPVTNLLTHIQLPVVQTLIVPFPNRPSRAALRSYLTTVAKTCTPEVLIDLRLLNLRSLAAEGHRPLTPDPDTLLTYEDLTPCMSFVNLRGIHLNLEWPVDLADGDVLALVSAWPHVEHILINDQWGWRNTGVTFRGLLEILRGCRRLQELCVAVDARSAVGFSQDELAGFVLQNPFWLNVADSAVEPDSLPAVRAALSALGISGTNLLAWCGSEMKHIPGEDTYRSRWMRLFR